MAFHDLSIRTRKSLQLALTFAFAIWVGIVGLLPPFVAGHAVGKGRLSTSSEFNDSGQSSQLSRYVSSRSSARRVELSEEDEESSSEESSCVSLSKRPSRCAIQRAALSFCIVSPDHLIELPGTPPPVALC